MKLAWGCSSERYQPEVLLEQAVLAEEAGFDAIFVSDVFHPWVDEGSAAGFAWSLVGAIAAKTSRIELVTTVTAPLCEESRGDIEPGSPPASTGSGRGCCPGQVSGRSQLGRLGRGLSATRARPSRRLRGSAGDEPGASGDDTSSQ